MSIATMAVSSTVAGDGTVRTPEDVAGLGTVLGVWAHPDDEVYLSAGIMAAAAEAGNRVVVITATRGERGTDDPAQWPPARLARLRIREMAASLAVLDGGRGHIEHLFLGDRTGSCYVDGALAHGSADRPVAALATLIDDIEPDTILTFGPDGVTGHPDHRAISAWTDHAVRQSSWSRARLLHATVIAEWARDFGDVLTPMDDGDDTFPALPRRYLAVGLDLDPFALDRKVASLDAHASQTRPLQRALGRDRYRAFVAAEGFRRAGSPAARGMDAAP